MREILFRGKRLHDNKWIYGNFVSDCEGNPHIIEPRFFYEDGHHLQYEDNTDTPVFIIPETVGQYTGLTDKNGKRIFEGDIVRYNTYDDFDCQSVAKFGEYNQDGSAGEYSASKCIGFYVDVDNFTCPDLCEYGSNCFSNYLKQQNILEVAQYCEIIGNIHDNPELLE